MTTTDAIVNTDALAPATMPTIDADAGVQPLADRIKSVFDDALAELIEKRDQLYADAIAPLELEASQLSAEYDELEARIQALEAILPAKERVIRHEADLLIVSGAANATQDAKAKMAELKELQHKPLAMREQQKEIRARLDEIQAEKRTIARQVFEDWYAKVQPVIRASERGLFITLLEGLSKDFYQFQDRVGMVTLNNRERPLLTQNHFSNLTADGRSPEWAAGTHWYGNRR